METWTLLFKGGIMPYPNQHAGRVRDPRFFIKDSFATKVIGNGISIILGKLIGSDAMVVQAYRFNKAKWTAEAARSWLRKHNIKTILFEPASKS